MFKTSLPHNLLRIGTILLAGIRAAIADPTTQPAAMAPYQIARFDHPPITESSGLIASRRDAQVFWTHNDSDNPPVLYAINRQGKLVAEIPVRASNVDWEDIANDDAGHLYLADIGNNGGVRNDITVYQFDEPDPAAPPSALLPRRAWHLRYPARPFDSEAFFVYQRYGYLISKQFGPAELYRFPMDSTERIITLERVCRLPIRSPVTAADISPDAQRLAIMTITGPYLLQINGNVASAATAQPRHLSLLQPDMEAICFIPGGLLATTESRGIFFFPDDAMNRAPSHSSDLERLIDLATPTTSPAAP